MRNIKLIIEYDGTNYGGWQKQKNNKTVQEEVEKAIFKVVKEEINLIGSSRTDAGVHAKGMVANFKTNSTVPSDRFREAINSKLPDNIGIVKSEEVPLEFHARYSAKGKRYTYTVINRYEKVALGKDYSCHVKEKLDLDKMREACKLFIGTHDFESFKSKGSSVKDYVRTIWNLSMESNGEQLIFSISGDGFLYNMVRIIVGTLIEVGKGKIEPNEISTIIKGKNRSLAGPCIEPNGLILQDVFYEK